MSAASSATLVGFSAAIITLIVTLVNNIEEFDNIIYVLVFYIMAVVFFIFATEFFILSAWDLKNHIVWGTIGSITYGLGKGWIIIGISLTFDILVNLAQLAYFTITIFFIGYILYYILRWKIKREDPYMKARLVTRALMMIQIFIGYALIYTLN